jgi:SlyX protein
MMTETDIEKLQAQLVELQTQLAFQELTIGELNQALALQQKDLEWVKRQWELLREEFANMQGQAPGATAVVDEKPPHY